MGRTNEVPLSHRYRAAGNISLCSGHALRRK